MVVLMSITKDGKFVQLDKPLTQHTIGEVLGLATQYDSFGMYNISKEGLLQVLTESSMSIWLTRYVRWTNTESSCTRSIKTKGK